MPAGTFKEGVDLRSTGDIISKLLLAEHNRVKGEQAYNQFNEATNPMTQIPAPASEPYYPQYPVNQQTGNPVGFQPQPIQVRGVPTQERRPLDPNSPEFEAASMQLMNDSPEAASQMANTQALRTSRLPKSTFVNQEAGAAGEYTQPAGGGEGTYRQLRDPQYRGAPTKLQKTVTKAADGKPHVVISGYDDKGFMWEHDMGEDASPATMRAGSGAGANSPLDPSAIEAMAQDMLLSGKPPPMGMGGASQRVQIYNRYGELAKENGMDAQARQVVQATTQAEQRNLANIIKQRSMVLAFERTAERNLKIALAQSGIVDRFGSPVFNRWKLYVQNKYGGDPEVARFDAAVHVAANEVAKVTSTTTGNLIPQQEREEYRKLLSTALNVEQFNGVVDILLQDMESRKKSYDEEIDMIKNAFPTLMASVQSPAKSPSGVEKNKPTVKFQFED